MQYEKIRMRNNISAVSYIIQNYAFFHQVIDAEISNTFGYATVETEKLIPERTSKNNLQMD